MRSRVLWAVVALGLLPAQVAATDRRVPPPGLAPVPAQNTLVFRRQDGSLIELPAGAQTWIWCGPWEEGLIETPSLHIITADPSGPPWWMLDAVLADVTVDQPILFPIAWTWPNPMGAQFFVADPPNELSTQMQDSGGSIVFHMLTCESSTEVQFSIDATIGSEFGDGLPITVRGDFHAMITGAPTATFPSTWGRVKTVYRDATR